jgi:hypothetical protein
MSSHPNFSQLSHVARAGKGEEAHAGTAGVILLFSPAFGAKSLSSLSRTVFSDTILLVAILTLALHLDSDRVFCEQEVKAG